jgi:DNA topoisomerase VI subunit B
MTELVLQTSDDLVARLAHEADPVRAVVELVWNVIDGEAHSVTVQLERDSMDAVSAVRVEDDGHGISSDEVEATFGRIGDSWKKHSARTMNGLRAVQASWVKAACARSRSARGWYG